LGLVPPHSVHAYRVFSLTMGQMVLYKRGVSL
jgi:hypothetical protein